MCLIIILGLTVLHVQKIFKHPYMRNVCLWTVPCKWNCLCKLYRLQSQPNFQKTETKSNQQHDYIISSLHLLKFLLVQSYTNKHIYNRQLDFFQRHCLQTDTDAQNFLRVTIMILIWISVYRSCSPYDYACNKYNS